MNKKIFVLFVLATFVFSGAFFGSVKRAEAQTSLAVPLLSPPTAIAGVDTVYTFSPVVAFDPVCSINWGDGTPISSVAMEVTSVGGKGNPSVWRSSLTTGQLETHSHIYAAAGSYHAITTCTDRSTGASGSSDTLITVTSSFAIGDVNRDGSVNCLDAVLINDFNAGLIILDKEQLRLADVNGDGFVNAVDASLIPCSPPDITPPVISNLVQASWDGHIISPVSCAEGPKDPVTGASTSTICDYGTIDYSLIPVPIAVVTIDPTITDDSGQITAYTLDVTNPQFFMNLVSTSGGSPLTMPFIYDFRLIIGVHTFTEVATDPAGRTTTFIKNFTVAPLDTDGDGVFDPDDECPAVPGTAAFNGCPSRLRVSVEEVLATKPATHQDTALPTKIFDASAGSCAATIGIQPINWGAIYNSCQAENFQTETLSPNDGGNKPRNLISDLVGLGATTGDKLVIVQSRSNPDFTNGYMGFQIPALAAGESRDVGFNIVPNNTITFVQHSYFTRDAKNFWHSARRAEVVKGSELWVYQPDYEIWRNSEQIYPFLFISDSDWTVDICLEVPAGYQIVAPGTCGQTLVANETKLFEFTLVDVGSPKRFDTKAKINVKHKGTGKGKQINLNIPSHNKNSNGKKAASLWHAVKMELGNGVSDAEITKMTKEIAREYNIAVPEWGISGKLNSRNLSASVINILPF